MKLFSLLVVMLVCVTQAQTLNYAGIDTTIITDFDSDSTKYSGVFPLSRYQQIRVDVLVDDTSNTGFDGDSAKFAIFMETGRFVYNSSNRIDTAWTTLTPLALDTFDILTSANMTIDPLELQTDGTFDVVFKKIDTTSVSGAANLSVQFAPEWDVLGRLKLVGLTGNITGSPLWLRTVINRRVYERVGP